MYVENLTPGETMFRETSCICAWELEDAGFWAFETKAFGMLGLPYTVNLKP